MYAARFYASSLLIQALSINLDGAFLCLKFGREAMDYELTNKQLYHRWDDTDNEIAKLYWLTKLRDRANCRYRDAQYYVDLIEATK